MELRKVTAADEEIYMALAEEFYRSPAVLHPIPASSIRAAFAEICRSDEYLEAFLIVSDGETVGYTQLAKTFSQEAGGRVLWIEELYLRPSWHGRDLGTEVLRWIEREYTPRFKRLRLEAEPANARAMSLYSKLGYKKLDYVQMIKEYGSG